MSATLVVMAAGMGSRFGGLKQAESITPDGKALVDFSVFDAAKSGFTKFVFIIRKDMEEDFKRLVGDRIAANVAVEYVFQPLRPMMLRVLRQTSSTPYSPCIMEETVIAVLLPLRTAFTM